MSHILVGFSTKKDDWLSLLICWFTRWRHSHVVLVNAEQTRIVESTSFPFQDHEDGEMRDGVREVPIAYLRKKDLVEIRKIEHPSPETVWGLAANMAKRKVRYDHRRVIDWLFRMGDGDDEKVTCEELIFVCAARAGHPLTPDGMKFTTPRDLYLISKEL